MDFEFRPYTPARTEDLLDFVATHCLKPYGDSHPKMFLEQLVKDDRKILDFWVSGRRALVGCVLDTTDNIDNSAEVTFLGWDEDIELNKTCLEQVFRWAENHYRQGPRSALDVIACDGHYPFLSDWLKPRGYECVFSSLWMECPVTEFRGTIETRGTWKEVTEKNVRAYFELSRDAFSGQREVNFASFEMFSEMALGSEPRPKLLIVNDAVVAFVKVKLVGPARGEIVSVGRASAERGQGLGPLVVTEGARMLKALGATTFELTVVASNCHAVRLYESCGFKRTLVFDTYRLE